VFGGTTGISRILTRAGGFYEGINIFPRHFTIPDLNSFEVLELCRKDYVNQRAGGANFGTPFLTPPGFTCLAAQILTLRGYCTGFCPVPATTWLNKTNSA